MTHDKRQFIHEYSDHFGCETVAYDPEPNRNVVATALKDKVRMVLFYFIIRGSAYRFSVNKDLGQAANVAMLYTRPGHWMRVPTSW